MVERVRLTIIGGGVVGCAIAWQLSQKIDDLIVIEKNGSIKAENQSSRNSGVIHAGVYYPQSISPLKAKLCVEGNRLLYTFCEQYDVPHTRVGKLILAANEDELPYLYDTVMLAEENGVPDVRVLTPSEASEMEPNVHCVKAVLFPSSGVIEPSSLTYQLYTLASNQGAYFMLGNEVTQIRPIDGAFEITMQSGSQQEVFETELLINSAGMNSDDVARMLQPDFPFTIQPYRGESMQFVRSKRPEVDHFGMNVYPVPMPLNANGVREAIPFDQFQRAFVEGKILKTVGVHLTPLLEIENHDYHLSAIVSVGPSSRFVSDKNDHSAPAFSRDHFHAQIQPIFPGLNADDLYFYQMGNQAKLKGHFDWVIQPDKNYPQCIHLVGIDSPGLTSCLAIAKYVEHMLGDSI
ncbi:NAD(P)/FAD-dependent oxidoreductase [candidate division KSB1 bacterium]|nr:NAD(P)/FAD-dependent oxidoreductase [candidate division KSB1 bacterium]